MLKDEFTECQFLKSSLVTMFDEDLFDDPNQTKQHFWIALGSSDGLNCLIAKNPAQHLIEKHVRLCLTTGLPRISDAMSVLV